LLTPPTPDDVVNIDHARQPLHERFRIVHICEHAVARRVYDDTVPPGSHFFETV
jgi:hypothetical protein